MAYGHKLGVDSYIQKLPDFEQFSKAVNHLGMHRLLVDQFDGANLSKKVSSAAPGSLVLSDANM